MEVLEFLLDDGQIFTTITLVVLIMLLIGNIITDKLKKYEDIDVNAAVTLMDEKDLIILDVREKKERSAGHIANDIHIPMSQVKNKLDALDNKKKVLVYCRSGARGISASFFHYFIPVIGCFDIMLFKGNTSTF
jgi:predicted sulfurtransferase